MRMRPVGSLTAGLLGVLSAVALGCGDDSTLLSAADAAGLKDTLEQVRGAVDERNCAAATARLSELRSDVVNLDGSVDRQLRVRLREEVDGTLKTAVEEQCDSPRTETVPTTTTPAPTGPTGPTEEEPPPTESTDSAEEPPPPAETTETIPAPTAPEPSVPAPAPDDPSQDPGGFGEDGDGEG